MKQRSQACNIFPDHKLFLFLSDKYLQTTISIGTIEWMDKWTDGQHGQYNYASENVSKGIKL